MPHPTQYTPGPRALQNGVGAVFQSAKSLWQLVAGRRGADDPQGSQGESSASEAKRQRVDPPSTGQGSTGSAHASSPQPVAAPPQLVLKCNRCGQLLRYPNWATRVQCPGCSSETKVTSETRVFQRDQINRDINKATQGKAVELLRNIGLRPHDVGSRNTDENGQMLRNQCFYLSIAHAYLGSDAKVLRPGLARRLKLAIESAVLEIHPAWAAGLSASNTGEGCAMVSPDFLPAAMHARDTPEEPNRVAKMAVCILDSVAGHVEVFLGPKYASLEQRSQQERNLILLWYVPGHYQCLVCDDEKGSKVKMNYDEFKALLTEHGVVCIETSE